MRKKIIAVIGSAKILASNKELNLSALAVGEAIVDHGYRLINGGMSGVMEASAMGAKKSSKYQDGDTIGILPSYNTTEANTFIDIPLATGIGIARNTILMASCDAVIALEGGSGTLSEIALAWQMKKPIVCYGAEGWHKKLKSLSLDERRSEEIVIANSIDQLHKFLSEIQKKEAPFKGISGASKLKKPDAISIINKNFQNIGLKESYVVLGKGSEGIVLENNNNIFKVFYTTSNSISLFATLQSLSDSLRLCKKTPPFPLFEVHHKDKKLLVTYKKIKLIDCHGGTKKMFVVFLRKLRKLGWCMTNVKDENFKICNDQLICIDIGRDIVPYSEKIFYSTCKRAFVTYSFYGNKNIKDLYQYTNSHDDFEIVREIRDVKKTPKELSENFKLFLSEVESE